MAEHDKVAVEASALASEDGLTPLSQSSGSAQAPAEPDAASSDAKSIDNSDGWTLDIEAVINAEQQYIQTRRQNVSGRMQSTKSSEAKAGAQAVSASSVGRTAGPLIGLALSGGGIRSAAFCLGALQAMDSVLQASGSSGDIGEPRTENDLRPSILDRFDYLSTVSGGGYIGASMVAAMSLQMGLFPFRSLLDQQETRSVQHLRDHSNYLFPRKVEIFRALAVYLRGLATNLFSVLLVLIWLALFLISYRLTLWCVPYPNYRWPSIVVLVLGFLALVAWGVRESLCWKAGKNTPELAPERSSQVAGIAALVGCVVWLDLSNKLLDVLIHVRGGVWDFTVLAGALASISSLIALFGPRLTSFLVKIESDPGWSAMMLRASGVAALWIGAAVLPVLLWIAALFLALEGLKWFDGAVFSMLVHIISAPSGLLTSASFPTWMIGVLRAAMSVFLLVVLTGIVGLCFWVFWRSGAAKRWQAGAVSLHRLYRDCLGRAFLFEPPVVGAPSEAEVTPITKFRLRPKEGEKGLNPALSPYLLVNTAINLQGSPVANKRGRNADFFLFSHEYIGSRSTGYVKTASRNDDDPSGDLASVIAASGAAFSSNMGANTIAPLTPTLALLNVRLGCWIPNPNAKQKLRLIDRLYFLAETFGMLDESGPKIYVSDGGHIDNLGLIELLRRRCKLIVVIDAEEDHAYSFSSFMILQRHARIDMGVRIDLPWEAIRAEAVKADGSKPGATGPHVAVGRIIYAPRVNVADTPTEEGVLIYVKSSLTDDENDIIRSYRRRYPRYPHETTLDQLFSEEQFEDRKSVV